MMCNSVFIGLNDFNTECYKKIVFFVFWVLHFVFVFGFVLVVLF